ncbi:sigma-70 family RNA polymerase sigma factor [Opitutales bacterium]|nr:sigma-70 family RNA polymerase sigma factor [Opitutales bacterium]MDC3282922.1 sigma-70 family RNA polymerase sigma factor [Opitutales bacterium]
MDNSIGSSVSSNSSLLDTVDGEENVFSLVQRAKTGDLSAFDSLMVRYRQRLYAVIYNMTMNAEDAADLTQESFVKAFRSLSKFREKSSFYTWLYRIGVNLTLSFLKKRKIRQFFSFDQASDDGGMSKDLEAVSSTSSTSVKKALNNELHEKLNEALSKLSDKHRTIVVLFEIDGLGHKEIAKIMNCTVGTVRSRLFYAKQQLQSYLSEYLN